MTVNDYMAVDFIEMLLMSVRRQVFNLIKKCISK